MKKLIADISINPNGMKMCLLDIDGVVTSFEEPFIPLPGTIDKVRILKEEGWTIFAFTSRGIDSLQPLINAGLILDGYIPKPVAGEIMIIDDILSEARNEL